MSAAQKIPLSPEQAAFFNSFPIRSTPCNVANIDDNDYDITGPQREEVLADFLKCIEGALSNKEFADKWQHLKIKVMGDAKEMAKM